jgi:group II intron reverse transcriptase/maturase
MHVGRQSVCIVPVKPGNLGREGPSGGKADTGNWTVERTYDRYMGSETVSTKLQRIAKLAERFPDSPLTTLSHHIDVDWLKEAYRRTRKDGSPGIDGQSAEDYARDLEGNLQGLLERMKSGLYKAPPVRRAYIPKGNDETRPIGIPTFEDKVAQRAVAMVLEGVYEQEFSDCSYGFRPGRSIKDALRAVWKQTMDMGGCWVVEVDIRKFFDTLDHRKLREIYQQRIRDGVLVRLINKWLHAGVMEEDRFLRPEKGTPQGGVISPILANIYLHEVLDRWFEGTVRDRLRGRAHLVRYADDFILGFSDEDDARRVMEVLPKRFEKFGLTVHPQKTRLVYFGRPNSSSDDDSDDGPPGTFDFLGFTHYWGRSRRGRWVVRQKTAATRLARAIRAIGMWCRKHRHVRVKHQHRSLVRKLHGHYHGYGIRCNIRALKQFREAVKRVWYKWLKRRSQRRRMNWERFNRLLGRYPLPAAYIPRRA